MLQFGATSYNESFYRTLPWQGLVDRNIAFVVCTCRPARRGNVSATDYAGTLTGFIFCPPVVQRNELWACRSGGHRPTGGRNPCPIKRARARSRAQQQADSIVRFPPPSVKAFPLIPTSLK